MGGQTNGWKDIRMDVGLMDGQMDGERVVDLIVDALVDGRRKGVSLAPDPLLRKKLENEKENTRRDRKDNRN